ncbi:MAG: ABC transporter ATP-binding protein [Terriglobia bacterium]|jgi:ABC-2 type transport system ATP-binding protein|nr:ABC transporter ATP-binding protein [Terriglobia bacterium]
MTEPVLLYQHVTKDYRVGFRRRRLRALHDFSLAVQPGEIFGFLGPNGAGKTTAIHLAMGFMHPTAGRGRMLGQEFGDAPTRSRVGFLAENLALHNRRVVELIDFYARLNKVPQPRRAARIAIDRLGLSDASNRITMKLSRGMQQRVGLAQAIVNNPDLLILDEPTSALDPVARVMVRELLLELKRAGKTVFVSSHLLSEVEAVCDRIGILRKGELVRVGTISELLENADRCSVVARGVGEEMFSGATSQNGFLVLEVERARQREIIERIWSAGGEVVSINPVRESLEEMFLRLAASGPESKQ